MFEHITENETKSTAETWNERVDGRMKELGLSQRAFIKRYRDKFHTGNQSDVSRWIRIGEKDGKTGNHRKFPDFETMKKIAEILGVSVGYLIGETDYENFEMERTSEYTGLSQEAIKGIRNITITGKSVPPFYDFPDYRITSTLEIILSSSSFVDYLKETSELAKFIYNEKNPKNYFEEAKQKIPDNLRSDVLELWSDAWDAVEVHNIDFTEEKEIYVKEINEAAGKDMEQKYIAELSIKASKYLLSETHIKMIDEIMSSDNNIEKMAPRLATKEEIERIIKNSRRRKDMQE